MITRDDLREMRVRAKIRAKKDIEMLRSNFIGVEMDVARRKGLAKQATERMLRDTVADEPEDDTLTDDGMDQMMEGGNGYGT